MEAIRDAFGKALVEAGSRYPVVVAVSCDLKAATRLQPFFKAFPERSIEVGIAEANGIGISAGLALSGYRPFISSFGAFLTGKNVEIRTSVDYNRAPVVLVGTHGGLIGADGATQAGLQDIAVMRSMPNMHVYQPATPVETAAMVDYVCRTREPVYLRIARSPVAELFGSDYEFVPGRGQVVREGSDVVVFSSGPPLHAALAAAAELEGEISVAVVNLPSLKPVDTELIVERAERAKLAISVEDHDIAGGLGGIVAEVMSERGAGVPLHRHGLRDTFIESGTPEELEEYFELDAAGITRVIRATWSRLARRSGR
jgi:transketolase